MIPNWEPGPPLDTFVVRLWHPSGHTAPWHGRVEHVQTGEGRAFRDLASLLAFIEEYVAGRGGDVQPSHQPRTR